jgi:hypothetical protein
VGDEIPVETAMALGKIVREVLDSRGMPRGKMLAFLRDFALKYYYAHKKGLDDYKEDLKEAYASWGVPMDVLDEVAKKIESRYSRRE